MQYAVAAPRCRPPAASSGLPALSFLSLILSLALPFSLPMLCSPPPLPPRPPHKPTAYTHLYPRKNSDAATLRSPPCELMAVKVAPAAIQTGFRSEMGDPVTMLPPRADTLRIWVPANHLRGEEGV